MQQQMNGILDTYHLEGSHFDEVYTESKYPKEHYETIVERFNQLSMTDFERINNEVKTTFFNQGITFAVYSNDKKADERIFPFDLFPGLFHTMNGCIWKRESYSEIRQSTCFCMISITKNKF